MSWDDFLRSKKIDGQLFRSAEPALWEEWKELFEQMHPKSFTAQKLYLINPVRRKYPLQTTAAEEEKPVKKAIVKPKMPGSVAKPKVSKPKPVAKAKPVIRRPKTD